MPFNPGNPPTYTRLFAFVDQFIQGETADRADFDTFNADLQASLNAAFAVFNGLSSNATDQRYLGLKSIAPTLRNDASALQNGDTYISTNVADAGTLYFRQTGDWNSVATAPFSAYFLTLIGSVDEAELRGLMGLGSAATSAAAAFATAAQGLKADSALQVPNLLGVNVTDWNSVSATKTGFYQSDTGATNSPYSGESFTGLYIARTATAGSLIIYGVTSNRIFIRQFNTTWGQWREFSLRTLGTSTDLDNIGVGVLAARFVDTSTGAPTGFGTYTGMVSHYGTDTVRWQIAIIAAQDVMLVRTYDGTSWGTWSQINTTGTDGPDPTTTGTDFDFTGIPSTATRIEIALDQVSLSGTDHLLVQLMTGGVPTTLGYVSTVGTTDSTSVNTISNTSGMIVWSGENGAGVTGIMTLLRLPGTNTWVQSHTMRRVGTKTSFGGGRIAMAGPVDGFRLTSSGTNTFDAGQAFIRWQT